MPSLLAVDLGVKTGFALYGRDGRLQWYRSHNFGNISRLRRGVKGILDDIDELEWLVLEGGGTLAEIWKHEADRREIRVLQISAEMWRATLLYHREQRSGRMAKHKAQDIARRIIEWSGTHRPTALRHDTAEAILAGFWGLLEVGWLQKIPPDLER